MTYLKRNGKYLAFGGLLGLATFGLMAPELRANPDAPASPRPAAPTPAAHPPRPFAPVGRDQFFVWRFPLPPGSGEAAPWLRDWSADPIELPAPGDGGAGDIGGEPCTTC
jgi:hypothetical protein